ncbi:MAG: hydroxymethylbilane synthase [Candidatus Zixiibacteriota bacterium]
MPRTHLIIGSRGSDLALYQANFIRDCLERDHNCTVVIRVIKTSGDRIDSVGFDQMEGKGFFTKELEDALLAAEIDLAVHSLKDLMTTQPMGLKLGAVGYRADRRELLLVRPHAYIEGGIIPVKPGAIIGTSAARRKAQIAFYNPHLRIVDLRGNVPTRVGKLRNGEYDAILIAAAGVKRLKLELNDLVTIELDPEQFLPAPAQGILGIQIRQDDPRVESVVSNLGTREDAIVARLERGLLERFDSGCSLPLGVYSEKLGHLFRLKAVLGVRNEQAWTGLKRADITGADVEEIIERAFVSLQESSVCCA